MHGGEKNGQGMGNRWKENITLQDGKKWQSDEATLKHIQNLQNIGENVTSLEQIDDYHQLSTRFSKEIDALLDDCTMEGPDHNALHKYLMPLMKKNKMLGKVKSTNRGEHILENMKTQLSEYQEFFKK